MRIFQAVGFRLVLMMPGVILTSLALFNMIGLRSVPRTSMREVTALFGLMVLAAFAAFGLMSFRRISRTRAMLLFISLLVPATVVAGVATWGRTSLPFTFSMGIFLTFAALSYADVIHK